jgi:serine/threonine protein phosphatase PrpC
MKTKANNQELADLFVEPNSQLGNIKQTQEHNQTYDASDNQLELSQIVQIMQFKFDSANSQRQVENCANLTNLSMIQNEANDFVLSEFLNRLRESLRLQDTNQEDEADNQLESENFVSDLKYIKESENFEQLNRTDKEYSFNRCFLTSNEPPTQLFSLSFNQPKTNDKNNNETDFANMQSEFNANANLDHNDLSSPSSSSSNSLVNYFDSCSSSSSSSSYIKQLIDSSSASLPFRVVYGHYGRAKNANKCEPHSLTKPNVIDASFLHTISNRLSYGDDAAFVFYDQETHMCYLGIADGVSANRQRGYDASLFPNALLETCTRLLMNPLNELRAQADPNESVLPKFILDESDDAESNQEELIGALNEDNSYAYLLESSTQSSSSATNYLHDCMDLYTILCNAHKQVQHEQIYGSSTVCLLSLRLSLAKNENEPEKQASNENKNERLLSTCNLGDSGYMLIRNKQVIFKSSAQSHRYNAPYQLGCTPPELLEHDLYRDRPEDSVCQTHRIKSGDFLIVSSDGLFDNLYEDEIAMIITNHIQSRQEQDSSAVNITKDMLDSACELLVQRASLGIKNFLFHLI